MANDAPNHDSTDAQTDAMQRLAAAFDESPLREDGTLDLGDDEEADR